jgi:hypothetical protein
VEEGEDGERISVCRCRAQEQKLILYYAVEQRRWVGVGQIYQRWPGGGMREIERQEDRRWRRAVEVCVFEEWSAGEVRDGWRDR